jgi:hypothetical protein
MIMGALGKSSRFAFSDSPSAFWSPFHFAFHQATTTTTSSNSRLIPS